MKANVLNANSGYILEAFVEVNGRKGWAVLTIGTNILPYDGSCQLRDARWGNYISNFNNYLLTYRHLLLYLIKNPTK